MKTRAEKILPLAALAILAISTVPTAFASTLTVNLNPATKTAQVTMDSYTNIILTYPNGSMMSNYLKGANSSISLKGNYAGGDQGAQILQGSFHDDDQESNAVVKNMSVDFSYSAKGNATALVIHKQTNITATLTGVFRVVNGSVTADLKWRSFVVRSALNLNIGDHTEDINYVGPVTEDSLSGHAIAADFLLHMFGGSAIWNTPTLNYSQLSAPLTTWTKNYDSSTNTTTYSKTITGTSTFTSSADINGQKYSFSAVSDPSAVVSMKGYASASGDSLTFGPAPPMSAVSVLLVAAAAGVIVVAGVAYFALRSRTSKAKPLAVPTPAVN